MFIAAAGCLAEYQILPYLYALSAFEMGCGPMAEVLWLIGSLYMYTRMHSGVCGDS